MKPAFPRTPRPPATPSSDPTTSRGRFARGAFARVAALALLATGFGAGSYAAATPPAPAPEAPTTIVLIRHAEKQTGKDAGPDPALTAAGARRAENLAGRFQREGGFQVIVHTEFRRTRDTAAPIGARCAVAPEVLEVRGDAEAHIRAAADRLRALPPGARALYVGHSNSIPGIIAALAPDAAPVTIDEREYGRIFTVTIGKSGAAKVSEEK